MKLYIQYKLNDSGKGKFLRRLIPHLEDLGVKCSLKDKKADITLGIRRFREKINGPKILRVDGIHMNTDKKTYNTNDLTRKSIKQADGVIWQSQFCKDIVSGVFGFKPKRDFVIFNGADPNEYRLAGCVVYKDSRSKYNVIMSARWKDRLWKRLKDCIKVAREVIKNEDINFWIAGKVSKEIKEDRIISLGHLPYNMLYEYLCGSHAMLNLSYYDWCPNAVVEALVAGVPVVCNNASGVREIIDPESCEVVNCDPEPVAKIRKHDKPPPVDPVPVAEALLRVLHSGKRANVPHLHIQEIARQYKAAFEKVLG
ncbi:MAG: glycosyltransferase family 4 protein [Desulfobacterales bacterium]